MNQFLWDSLQNIARKVTFIIAILKLSVVAS